MSVTKRQWKKKDGGLGTAWEVNIKKQLPGRPVVRVRKTFTRQNDAKAFERETLSQIANGTFGKEVHKEQVRVPTVEEFVPHFLTYSENNNKASTVAAKRQALRDHILPYFGKMRLDQIRLPQVEDFKAAMRRKLSSTRPRKDNPTKWAVKKRYGTARKQLSDKSINNVLAVLRKLLSLAEEHQVIPHTPKVKLFKTGKTAFDFLDFDEAERLVKAADPEHRTVILLAIKSGLRLGELISLQWTDLDLVRGKLTVNRTVWKGIEDLPKGGRERTVDLPSSAIEALKGQKARTFLKGRYVFCQEDGERLTPGKLKTALTRALRRSGVSRAEGRIGWHDLRHTYGSHLAMKGVPLKVIQELMGHATMEMTMRYAHLSPETRREAVRVLDEPATPGEGAEARSAWSPQSGPRA
jgi:integrase